MYDAILVPIEPAHEHSGVNAVKIAKKLMSDDGKIFLVSVVEDLPTHIQTELLLGYQDNSKSLAKEKLKEIALNEGIGSNVEIRTGNIANEILDMAKSHNINLIIIASHRPGLSDYFLGSTAARIVRHAQCPVFVDR